MPRARLFLFAGVFSLLAVLAGLWAAFAAGVPASLALRNLAAWIAGAGAALVLARWAGRGTFLTIPVLALVVVAASLTGPGLSGVHRWVAAGPLTLNAAMLALPAALAATAALSASARRPIWIWLCPIILLALLVTQPDASQASAFGAGIILLALGRRQSGLIGKCVAMGSALLIAAAWYRPDPLAPVPEVEEIHTLAAVSPLLSAGLLASLFLFCLVPLLAALKGQRPLFMTGAALSLYFLVQAVMPFVGAYPVPLAGMGVSAILGAWLGLGVFAAARRRA